MVSPVALSQHPGNTHKHTGQQAHPRTGSSTEAAVKTEHQHRAATAHPHRGHQSNKQTDVVQLRHKT